MSISGTSPLAAEAIEKRSSGRVGVSTRLAGLLLSLFAIAVSALLSLRYGSLEISTTNAWNAIFAHDPAVYEQTVVRELRVPRTLIALSVGGALGVAGAVMQGVTRNPLAGPSILGVSSGASFAITTAIFYLGRTSPAEYLWFAFAGAIGASALVFAVGAAGRDGATPVKLALAGVVISALLGSWTSSLLLLNEETMDAVRIWVAGSVIGRDLDTLWTVSPFLFGGALGSLFLGHQLNVLSMGDDTARSLGMHTTRTRLIASAMVVLITGAAVSVAGPIGFVGLATPHIARAIVGVDYRWVLPYSFVFGAILLTVADVAGRLLVRPAELQVGIVTAIVGAPFLVWLARQRNVAG